MLEGYIMLVILFMLLLRVCKQVCSRLMDHSTFRKTFELGVLISTAGKAF